MKAVCLVNTRDHARFIDECVLSCLAQEVPPGCRYEVHAVDAGSTDGTLERLSAYGGRVTTHPRGNIGQSGAFELCLALDADVFLFCDGDDRLKPGRLRRVMDVFGAHPEVVMVGNSITEVDAEGSAIREVFVGEDQQSSGPGPHDVRDGLTEHRARSDHLEGVDELCVYVGGPSTHFYSSPPLRCH